MKLKTILSATLIASMLIGMFAILPMAFAQDAEIKVEDARTGGQDIVITNVDALSWFLVNISLYNAPGVAAWQMKLTWDPTLLELTDQGFNKSVFIPSDNIFGQYADIIPATFASGEVFQGVGLSLSAPSPSVDVVAGRLCVVNFTILQQATPSQNYTGVIHLVTEAEDPNLGTFVVNTSTATIPAIYFDGNYENVFIVPPMPKPNLTVEDVVMGNPTTWPVVNGTEFDVPIMISNVVNDVQLVGVQFTFKFDTTLFQVITQPSGDNASEGTFMSSAAPYGTDFFTNWGGMDGSMAIEYCVIVLNPNPDTGIYDMTTFPSGSGTLLVFHFIVTTQNEKPWQAFIDPAFVIDYMFVAAPDEMFLDKSLAWIPNTLDYPHTASYTEYGYVVISGLMLDVYTQHIIGGQGFNTTSDGFEPQETVQLCANLTYNGDVVQNKPVAFHVYNGAGVNFTKTAVTDANGVACITFGIEWPCTGAEAAIFGIWEVDATSTVREMQVNDTTWFKVFWPLMNLKVDEALDAVKGTSVTYTVSWESYLMHQETYTIALVLMDDLKVPVAMASTQVTVGNPALVWCTSEPGSVQLTVFVPKWAFVGVNGELEVSVLTDFPANGGVPVQPEATAQVAIVIG